jgi:transposase
VYEVLEAYGIEVMLVNARNVKHVSGRKSDVLDCQWLQQLLSVGLLSAAFRPPADVCALRAISRQRDTLRQEQARCVQRMPKALTQMNLQLTNTRALMNVCSKTGNKDVILPRSSGHSTKRVISKTEINYENTKNQKSSGKTMAKIVNATFIFSL